MADVFISTLEELQAMALLTDWSDNNNYYLVNDIDVSPASDLDQNDYKMDGVADLK